MRLPPSSPSPAGAPRYGRVARSIHWATAILVLAAFIYGPGGPEARVYAASRDFDRHLHETLGSAVFALAVLRVLWRLVDRRPDPVPVARWMGLAARAVQGLLNVLLFAVPATAIAGAWLEGHPLAWLGGVEIAPPVTPAHDAGAALAWLHGWLGDLILWTAGVHAAAALYHRFVLHDGVLESMLPAWAARPRPGDAPRR